MKAVSLFSGMGGDSLAIKNCGIELVAYSEINKTFRETHNLNFPDCELLGNGDIIKTTNDEILAIKKKHKKIDLVFAGFPCQGFSNAGKKLPDDPRNTLFREFARVVENLEPDYLIGENVKGLINRQTADGSNYIDIIESVFNALDYNIYYEVMKTNHYGIPQKRERLVIVGIKKSLNKTFEFPKETNEICNLQNIVNFNMTGTLKIKKDNPNYHIINEIPKECILTDKTNNEKENIRHPNLKLLAEDVDYEYTIKKRKKNSEGKTIIEEQTNVYPNRLSFGKRDSSIHGEIIDIRNPSKTIICTYARQPRLFVPLRNKNGYYLRCLLPDELKQIQGFPEDYKLTGKTSDQIVMIGNAVPPLLIEKIINKLI